MSAAATDLSLLRWLRARVDATEVLNAGDGPAPTAGPDIAGRLMQAARALLPPSGREGVPYARVSGSPAFAAYRDLTRALRGLDPAALVGREARTAFWINVYNALVIDAVISFGVSDSIRETPGFFHRAAYRVGPHRFALDEIENGLLRCNRPLFARLPPPFAPGDPRADLGPGVLDPRVHFALNCGTRSCPPVAFYEPERLDEQLDAAASSFINAEGIAPDGAGVRLSPIFSFYAEDFGGPDGARAWALRYVADPALRARLRAGPVLTGVYDWSLNLA